MSTTPVTCTLDAPERAARSQMYRRDLFARALERQDRPDGYAFRLPDDADTRAKIEAFIDAERRCCAFLRIDVLYEPALGPVWLTLTGPEGTRTFIEETFAVDIAG